MGTDAASRSAAGANAQRAIRPSPECINHGALFSPHRARPPKIMIVHASKRVWEAGAKT